MYLSFISDIAKPGDFIAIECNDAIYQGIIVKLSDAFVAVKLDNGALIIKKDEDITNVVLNPLQENIQSDNVDDNNSP